MGDKENTIVDNPSQILCKTCNINKDIKYIVIKGGKYRKKGYAKVLLQNIEEISKNYGGNLISPVDQSVSKLFISSGWIASNTINNKPDVLEIDYMPESSKIEYLRASNSKDGLIHVSKTWEDYLYHIDRSSHTDLELVFDLN